MAAHMLWKHREAQNSAACSLAEPCACEGPHPPHCVCPAQAGGVWHQVRLQPRAVGPPRCAHVSPPGGLAGGREAARHPAARPAYHELLGRSGSTAVESVTSGYPHLSPHYIPSPLPAATAVPRRTLSRHSWQPAQRASATQRRTLRRLLSCLCRPPTQRIPTWRSRWRRGGAPRAWSMWHR